MKKIFFIIFVSILLVSCSNKKNIDNLKKEVIIQEEFSSGVITPYIPEQPDL